MQIYYCIPATTIFQDEAAYCLQDTFKLTKAIMKCQLDIFEQIGLILAELQEQAKQEAGDDGNEVKGIWVLGAGRGIIQAKAYFHLPIIKGRLQILNLKRADSTCKCNTLKVEWKGKVV